MNKAWKFCDNCQQWRYLVTVNERTFCETCGCAPGQKDDDHSYQPSYTQERDWRILRWAARWGGDLRDDVYPGYPPVETIDFLTAPLVGPSEAEAQL